MFAWVTKLMGHAAEASDLTHCLARHAWLGTRRTYNRRPHVNVPQPLFLHGFTQGSGRGSKGSGCSVMCEGTAAEPDDAPAKVRVCSHFLQRRLIYSQRRLIGASTDRLCWYVIFESGCASFCSLRCNTLDVDQAGLIIAHKASTKCKRP
jgi:hypothetical protein